MALSLMKCVTCGGQFAPRQADGTTYAHVCARLSDAEVGAQLGKPLDPTLWLAKDKADVAAAPRARANARNENVPEAAALQPAIDAVPKTDDPTYWKAVNAITATAIVAPGAGVTPVP